MQPPIPDPTGASTSLSPMDARQSMARMLLCSLDHLSEQTNALRRHLALELGMIEPDPDAEGALEGSEETTEGSDVMALLEAFDIVLGIALEARNSFCREANLPIENANLQWDEPQPGSQPQD